MTFLFIVCSGMWLVTCEVGLVVQLQQNKIRSDKEKQFSVVGRTKPQSLEIPVQIGVCADVEHRRGTIKKDCISTGTLLSDVT